MPDSRVGKSVAGPRTFATMRELLCYNCSPLCRLSAQWLCDRPHTSHFPGLLLPEPLSPRQPLLTRASTGDTEILKSGSGSGSLGSLGPVAHKVLFEPSKCLWRVWGLILNMISSLLPSCWRRKWQPTPVFFPGESHGWKSLVGYSPRGRKESDTTECLHLLTILLLLLLCPLMWGIFLRWDPTFSCQWLLSS